MSREFGSHQSGYFHTQMDQAASDCLDGRDELTKLWGKFLFEFKDVAWAIASSEACDSGPEYPIEMTSERLPRLQDELDRIKDYVAKRKMESTLEEER